MLSHNQNIYNSKWIIARRFLPIFFSGNIVDKKWLNNYHNHFIIPYNKKYLHSRDWRVTFLRIANHTSDFDKTNGGILTPLTDSCKFFTFLKLFGFRCSTFFAVYSIHITVTFQLSKVINLGHGWSLLSCMFTSSIACK